MPLASDGKLGYDFGIRRFGLLSALVTALLLVACDPNAPLHHPLTPQGDIQLPPDTAQPAYDLLALDARIARLYISHTSSATMDVVDVHAKKLVGRVDGLIGIKGIAVTNDPKVVFTSDADGSVAVIDTSALKILKKLDVGGSPDAIDFDPVHNIVAVSLSSDKALALIDAASQKVVARVPLPGDPELTTVDPQSGTIYLAIHDMNEVVAIDSASQAITKTYKGCDIKLPTGLAFDPDQGRLFVAGSANLAIIDVVLDRCLGGVDIGHGTDQIGFNRHTHHVYTADGSSRYVSVVDSVTMQPLGTVGTGRSASTLAVDPSMDTVYVMVKPAGVVAVYHDP